MKTETVFFSTLQQTSKRVSFSLHFHILISAIVQPGPHEQKIELSCCVAGAVGADADHSCSARHTLRFPNSV